MADGVNEVKQNLKEIYNRKIKETLALCEWYAARAVVMFRKFQGMNVFWNNQTGTAYSTVFTEAISTSTEIGWFMAHAVEYGVCLELANDRKHEAIRPIVQELSEPFMADLRAIWE